MGLKAAIKGLMSKENVPEGKQTREIVTVVPQMKTDQEERKRTWESFMEISVDGIFGSGARTINDDLRTKLHGMRKAARELAKNDDYVRGFLNSTVNNTLGSAGIRMDAVASYADGVPDETLAKVLEGHFQKWGSTRNEVDVAHRSTWREIQRVVLSRFLVDGEVFIRHIEGAETGDYGYSVELIEADRCDVGLNMELDSGNRISMGVEVDDWNRPVAYYFLSKKKNPDSVYFGDRLYTRVEASKVIHAFRRETPEQDRGIPLLAPTKYRLDMLEQYENAALSNAVYGAAVHGAIQSANGQTDPIDSLATNSTVGTTSPQASAIQDVSPSQIITLNPNETWVNIPTNYPDGEMPEFCKHMLKSVAASLGIPAFMLMADYSEVNFSSARMGNMEARQVWEQLQLFLIEQIVTPIFERWLTHALLRGKIALGRKRVFGIQDFDRCSDVEFRGERWSYVDPAKEANANATLVALGVKAPSTVAQELGINYETEVKRIARDKRLREQVGLEQVDERAVREEADRSLQMALAQDAVEIMADSESVKQDLAVELPAMPAK